MSDHKTIAQYELIELLGRGSFGTVWEARHAELDRPAAVKLLNGWQADPRQAQRFLREAQISANLQHPHIVTLLEAGRAQYDGDEIPFLAYELIDGVTLNEWCKFTQPSWERIAELVAKIASAVHYAHDCGVVHRDLKPENIIVDLSGEPHVTDFGLARRLDDRLTEQNVALGTIAYMSPEQAEGNSADVGPLSDIFSMGVIFFELLTAELPFKGLSITGYISELAKKEPTLPQEFARKIPRDLATICLKCLAKKPTDRYASAQLLEEDLHRFIVSKPIQARPVSIFGRLRRWAVRQPMAAILVGVLAIAAVVGPLVAVQQARLRSQLTQTAQNLRVQTYGTDLYLAYQAWNEGRLNKTRKILDRSLPAQDRADLRCFAWHFLNDRVQEAYRVVARPNVPINDFAVTADGRQLLTVGASGTMEVSDLANGNRLRSTSLVGDSQFAIALLSDSVLVGDRRNDTSVVDIYDAQSHQFKKSLTLDTSYTVESIRVADDESMFAVGTRYHGIHIFDAESIQQGFLPNCDRNGNVAISPNSRYLVASFNEEVDGKRVFGISLWNLSDRSLIKQRRFAGKVFGLAWRPDSKYLVVHTAKHSGAFVASIPSLETVAEVPHGRHAAYSVDYYSGGRDIIGADAVGSLFTRPIMFDGHPKGGIDYFPHVAEVNRLGYIGRGEVLSVSDDGTAVVSHPSELHRGGANVLMTVGKEGRLAFSSGRDRFFVGDRDGILRDHRGVVLHTFRQPIHALASITDDTQVACGLYDGTIVVVNSADGSVVNTLEPRTGPHDSHAVNAIVECDGSTGLVGGSHDCILRLWRHQEKKPKIEIEVAGIIPAIAFDEKNHLAFVGGHSEHIVAIDTRKECEAFRLKTSSTTAITIDRKRSWLVSGHSDGGITVWDISTREKMGVLSGHTARVLSLAISPGGDILASSADDGSVRFWNLAQMTEIGIAYQARPGWAVRDLAFGIDDTRSLHGILWRENQRSLVLRMGGDREAFSGYEVRLEDMDYRNGVKVQVTDESGTSVLECENRTKLPGQIGVWLDERFKGHEVRATFRLDLTAGTAKAVIDHYYARDRDNVPDGFWHGGSHEFKPGEDLKISTDWVRITHGDWFAGPDKTTHPYGAVLVLPPGAKAIVRSVQIEARDVQ